MQELLQAPGARRINRNIMECKVTQAAIDSVKLAVLIETLWNVKVDNNVSNIRRRIRINRNIMECKGA